jgi:hypothetical protein
MQTWLRAIQDPMVFRVSCLLFGMCHFLVYPLQVWHLLIQQDRLSALRQLLCALEVLAEDTGGISLLVSLNVGVTPGMTPAQTVSVSGCCVACRRDAVW